MRISVIKLKNILYFHNIMVKGKITAKQLKLIKNMLKKGGKNRNSIVKRFMTIFLVLFLLTSALFIFQIYVHMSYVEKLKDKDCECSEDWKRKWVKYGPLLQFIIMFALGIVQILLFTLFNLKIHTNVKKCVSLILPIIYVLYIYGLMKIDCQCSEDWRRTFILIISSIGIFTQVIALIYSINM